MKQIDWIPLKYTHLIRHVKWKSASRKNKIEFEEKFESTLWYKSFSYLPMRLKIDECARVHPQCIQSPIEKYLGPMIKAMPFVRALKYYCKCLNVDMIVCGVIRPLLYVCYVPTLKWSRTKEKYSRRSDFRLMISKESKDAFNSCSSLMLTADSEVCTKINSTVSFPSHFY